MRLLKCNCTQTRNTISLSSELLVRRKIGPLDRFLLNGHRGSVVSKDLVNSIAFLLPF